MRDGDPGGEPDARGGRRLVGTGRRTVRGARSVDELSRWRVAVDTGRRHPLRGRAGHAGHHRRPDFEGVLTLALGLSGPASIRIGELPGHWYIDVKTQSHRPG